MVLFNGEGKVEEVDLEESFRSFPAKLVEVIEAGLETSPGIGVGVGIGDDPYPEHVVDVSAKEEEVVSKLVEEFELEDGIKESCVWGCRRRAHRTAGELVPKCVSKLKHIIFHYQAERIEDGIDWEMGKFRRVDKEVPADFL